MEEKMYDMKKLVIVGVIFFVVGFGASWLIFGRSQAPSSAQGDGEQVSEEKGNTSKQANISGATETPQAPTPTPATAGKNAIGAENQPPGSKVKLGSLSLEKTGWAVVHEDRDGKPGNILGAQRFAAGTYTTGEVDLLRKTTEGKAYYAMLHADDGDGKFDHKKDLPLLDASGSPLMVKFTATAAPAVQ